MNYKKLFVGLAVVALIFGITAVSAKAATIEELLAQIALLQQQLNQMQGGSGGGSAPMPPLTLGSTGEGVRSLQQWLNGHGYPVASTGPGSAGMESTYFGALTQAAVARFQAANGISPAAGYYGNLTYNAILSMGGDSGGGGGSSGKAQCADGMDNDSDGKIDGFDADCSSIDDTSESAGGGGGSGQSDGKLTTIAATLESSPADGTDVASDFKGIELAKWKLRTSSSPGILKQFGIQTTNRSWLYWLNARLYVGDTMIAEKTGLSSASFSEVTVGSKYNLTFDNMNYSLPVDTDVYVTLKIDAISDTGRSASSGLIIQQDTNQIIVLDANDNYSVSTGTGTGTSNDRTWDWIASQTGNVVPSNNVATPSTRWVKVSEQGITNNVTMQVFDLKAEAKDIEVNTVAVSASTSGTALATLISGWDLYEGNCVTDGSVSGCTGPLAGGSVSGSVVTFSNLSIQIPKDTKKSFTVKVKFADEDDYTASLASAASTTVYASVASDDGSYIAGIDKPTFNTLTASGSNVSAGDVKAILYAPTLAVGSAACNIQDDDRKCQLSYKFSLSAAGGAIYLSKVTDIALSTSSDLGGSSTTGFYGNKSTAATTGWSGANPATIYDSTPCSSCDSGTTTAYVIPDGMTRSFEVIGGIENGPSNSGTAGVKNFKITRIFFGASSTNNTVNNFYFDTSFTQLAGLSSNTYLNTVDAN